MYTLINIEMFIKTGFMFVFADANSSAEFHIAVISNITVI